MVQDVKYKVDIFLQQLQKIGVRMVCVNRGMGVQGYQGMFIGKNVYYRIFCLREQNNIFCQLVAQPNQIIYETRNLRDLDKFYKKVMTLKGGNN